MVAGADDVLVDVRHKSIELNANRQSPRPRRCLWLQVEFGGTFNWTALLGLLALRLLGTSRTWGGLALWALG